MSAKVSPNQFTILESLIEGPRWKRSFQTVLPLVDDLIARELIEPCRPHLGRGRNMLRLTDAGCALIEIDPASVPKKRQEAAPAKRKAELPIGAIKPDVPDRVRLICEAFLRAVRNGTSQREAVGQIALARGRSRHRIWTVLRIGGVLPPYQTKEQRRAASVPPPMPMPRPRPPVSRDPCPRCGARGDVECGHSRRQLGVMFG